MNAFADKVLAWLIPPTPRLAYSRGLLARGLAQMRGVGCRARATDRCPSREREDLFTCADCTAEGAGRVLPPL